MTVVQIERDRIVDYIRDHNRGLQDRMNVITYGPPGTGKTTLAWASALPGQPIYEVTCTSEQSAAVLTGFFVPKGDRFEHLDGPLTRAWLGQPIRMGIEGFEEDDERGDAIIGGLLVINEIDKASPDVADIIHVGADDQRVAIMYLPDGRIIRPANGFWCWATMNGNLEDLSDPVLDRFPLRIPVWEPGQGQLDLLSPATQQICRNFYTSVAGTGRSPQFTYRELRAFDRLVLAGSPANLAAASIGRNSDASEALAKDYTITQAALTTFPVTSNGHSEVEAEEAMEGALFNTLDPTAEAAAQLASELAVTSEILSPLFGESVPLTIPVSPVATAAPRRTRAPRSTRSAF
jgi:hypothetical protein